MATGLPDGLLIGWYGDDFTGSAAVMEALTFAGLPSVLFLAVPTPAQRARFADVRGLGIASTARAHGPEWMAAHLPPAYRWLAETGAPLCHYKTCSTLDSSPDVGSIGTAIELGDAVFAGRTVPFLVAAPEIRRYQAFGHLFAGAGEGVYRLDRHPVMARHPVTPMDEADVARHLARQTAMPSGLVSLEDLTTPARAADKVAALAGAGARLITFDCMGTAELETIGALLWEGRGASRFVAGSQGIEYALIAHFRAQGWLPAQAATPRVAPVAAIAVVSGSVSPTTRGQIAAAEAAGFAIVPFDAAAVVQGARARAAAIETAVAAALAHLAEGRSPVIASARGPDDPAVAAFRAAVAASGQDSDAANHGVGQALGVILDRVMRAARLTRGVVAGGDTSGHVMQHLGAFALTALAQTVPGAALFTVHSEGAHDGIELALKGGQMGREDMFASIRAGGAL